MASRELQGWQPDPFGLHEMRYFSAGRPTKLVRDGRVEAYEEPPDDWAPVGTGAGAEATAVDSGQIASASADVLVAASAGSAIAGTAMSSTAVAGQPDPTVRTQTLPVAYAGSGAVGQTPFAVRRRRRVEYGFVAAGAVVAVLVFVALGGGLGSGKRGLAPAAFVTKAAQQTLAQRTADFTLSATANVAGQTLAMAGTGEIDIAKDAMSVNLGASTAAGYNTENEIIVGGSLYVQSAVNGHSQTLSGGRHWVEVPLAPVGGRSFATASPDYSLSILSQPGASVTQLGARSVGGLSCNGYSVTPSRQAMLAGARQEFAKIGMSTADTNAALQALQNVQPPTITAWLDENTGLACQVTVSMQFGAPTQSGLGSVQSQLTFTKYGAAVNIMPPPPTDTLALQQFPQTTTHA